MAMQMAAIGKVVDAPFPSVNPDWSTEDILAIAEEFAQTVADWSKQNGESTALVDGQSMMAMAIVCFLQAQGFRCVSTRSPRNAEVVEDEGLTDDPTMGETIQHTFQFEGWREWPEVTLPTEMSPDVIQLSRSLTKIKDVKTYDAGKMNNAQLMDDHRIVHAWMSTIQSGKKFVHSKATVQRIHDQVVREVIDRGFRHFLRSDMDRETINNLGQRYIEQWAGRLREDISRFDPQGEKGRDAAKTLRALTQKRMLKAISKMQDILTVQKAPISFKPTKPGHRLISLEEEIGDVLEDSKEMVVQVKFDGIRIIIVRTGDSVHLLSEDQLYEKADKLPTLVGEIKDLPGGDIILDAEALLAAPGAERFEYRTEIAGVLNSKEQHEREGDVTLLVFDVLKYQGEDYRDMPYEERLSYMKDFKDTPHVKFIGDVARYTKRLKNPSKAELASAIKEVGEIDGSEGAMIKDLQSTYEEAKLWWKYKEEFELDCLVIEKREAGKSAWTYGVAIGPISKTYAEAINDSQDTPTIGERGLQLGEKRGESNPPLPAAVQFKDKYWMVVGRAFNSGMDIAIGGVIRVAVQQVLATEINEETHYTIFLPRPVEDKSGDRVSPDSIDVAKRLSAKSLRRVKHPDIGKMMLIKQEIKHGPKLDKDILDSRKDGEPLPAEYYKYPDEIRDSIERGRWFYGWLQAHWRGMSVDEYKAWEEDKNVPLFKDHSVHFDLRLELPKSLDNELIQWVLAGKIDRLLRGMLGTTDPDTDRVQSLMAIVKPSAFESGLRAERLIRKAWGPAGYPSRDELVRRLASGSKRIRSGEDMLTPLKGYFMEPDDPANLSGEAETYAYLQLIDEFEWCPGVQRTDAHEYFFRKSKHGVVDGRYVLRVLAAGSKIEDPTEPGEEQPYWLFLRPPDQLAMDPSEHNDAGKVRPLYPKQLIRSAIENPEQPVPVAW